MKVELAKNPELISNEDPSYLGPQHDTKMSLGSGKMNDTMMGASASQH